MLNAQTKRASNRWITDRSRLAYSIAFEANANRLNGCKVMNDQPNFSLYAVDPECRGRLGIVVRRAKGNTLCPNDDDCLKETDAGPGQQISDDRN
jgi:hypothetical protein